MNVAHLLTSTAVVTTVTYTGSADAMGDPTAVTASLTFRCWLSQTQRAEVTDNTAVQQETWDLYLEPAAADAVEGFDRVTVAGVTYEFVGPPWTALNPRTQLVSHVECTVRRTR